MYFKKSRRAARIGGAAAVVLCGALLGATLTNAPASAAPRHLTAFQAASSPDGFSGVCQRYAWACATSGGRLSERDALARARRVNSEVNWSVRPVSDLAQYGRSEHWTLPYSGAGDCEDYALLKKKKLIEAGVPANRLFLATAFNRRNEHHVVLVLRTAAADLVLDNLSSGIKTWQATGYTFVKMQNPRNKNRWDAILLGPRATRSPVS